MDVKLNVTILSICEWRYCGRLSDRVQSAIHTATLVGDLLILCSEFEDTSVLYKFSSTEKLLLSKVHGLKIFIFKKVS